MNPSQKKYAMERIQQVKHQKLHEARQKFFTEKTILSQEEKYELVKNGKVELFPAHRQSYYNGYFGFDFSKYEVNEKFDKDAYDKIEAALNTMAVKASDMIMLGDDCKEAVAILNKLENFKI